MFNLKQVTNERAEQATVLRLSGLSWLIAIQNDKCCCRNRFEEKINSFSSEKLESRQAATVQLVFILRIPTKKSGWNSPGIFEFLQRFIALFDSF